MKLKGAEAARFCAKPGPEIHAALIYGPDPTICADRAEALLTAALGPNASEEMRLDRMIGAALRDDPAVLDTALRAQGFFPGRRGVLLKEPGEIATNAVKAALDGAVGPDAFLVVVAGALAPKSALRKTFETARNAAALAFYPDALTADALERALGDRGVRMDDDAKRGMETLLRDLDHGAAIQLIEKIDIYKLDDDKPLSLEDLANCAPIDIGGDVDRAVDAVFDGDARGFARIAARLAAKGGDDAFLVIALGRKLRLLLSVATAPGGLAAGLANIRPPLYGPRRDALARQARRWDPHSLERALAEVHALECSMRRTGGPDNAVLLERALLRIALSGPR